MYPFKSYIGLAFLSHPVSMGPYKASWRKKRGPYQWRGSYKFLRPVRINRAIEVPKGVVESASTLVCFSTAMQSLKEFVFISKQQVAKFLGCSTRTIDREVARGRFPSPHKVGNRARFTIDDLSCYKDLLADERRKRLS